MARAETPKLLPDELLTAVLSRVYWQRDLLGLAALVCRQWSAAAAVAAAGRPLHAFGRDGLARWLSKHHKVLGPHLTLRVSSRCGEFPLAGLACLPGLLSLDLSYCRKPFPSSWPEMPSLTRLRLSNFCVQSEPPDSQPERALVGAALAQLQALSRLELQHCQLTVEDLAPLSALRQLEALDLKGTSRLDPAKMPALSSLPIVDISLGFWSTDPREAQGAAAWLAAAPCCLKSLDLRALENSAAFQAPFPGPFPLADGLARHTLLQRLACRGLRLDDLLPAVSHLRHLRALQLLDCTWEDPRAPAPWRVPDGLRDLVCCEVPKQHLKGLFLAAGPAAAGWLRLERLRLKLSGLGDALVASVVRRLPGLQSLWLEGRRLTLEVAGGLTHLTALTALALLSERGFAMPDDDADAMIECVKAWRQLWSLQELHAYGHTPSSTLDDDELCRWQRWLRSCVLCLGVEPCFVAERPLDLSTERLARRPLHGFA